MMIDRLPMRQPETQHSGLLMQALKLFEPQSKGTRVQLSEVVLSGADDALIEGNADLVIGASTPSGFLGDHLRTIDFIAVANPHFSPGGVEF